MVVLRTRDRAEWAAGDARARAQREATAGEVAERVAAQARELLIEGDVMGGRDLFLGRLRTLLEAERSGDREALRAAVMDVSVAAASWAAALDFGATRG